MPNDAVFGETSTLDFQISSIDMTWSPDDRDSVDQHKVITGDANRRHSVLDGGTICSYRFNLILLPLLDMAHNHVCDANQS